MAKKEEVIESTFTLPNKKVIVKFIPKKKGMAATVSDDHVISGGMMSNSVKKYYAPLQKKGGIANILTKEEKDYLENLTGLNLSVYGDFWETFSVSLHKEDSKNIFDLSDPLSYISIRLLSKIDTLIAKSWKDRKKSAMYEFAITEENELENDNKVSLDTKKNAFKHYVRIEDDKETLLSILRLTSDLKISEDSSLPWIQGKVEEYLDNHPEKYLNIVNEPTFEVKALINKAVDRGIIKNESGKYSSIDGLDFARKGELPSFDNAVKYLNDPKNQEIKDLIEARLNNTK